MTSSTFQRLLPLPLPLFCLLLLLLSPGLATAAAPKNITLQLGLIFQWDDVISPPYANEMFLAAQMAVDRVNSLETLLPDFNLTLRKYDQTNPIASVTSTVLAVREDLVMGMIGDMGSADAIPAALVHSGFKIPKCSGAATSPTLSDKSLYDYFFRTLPNDNYQGEVIVNYIKTMGWKRIGIVFTTDAYGQGLAYSVSNRATDLDLEVVMMLNVVSNTRDVTAPDSAYDAVMQEMKGNDVRIVVLATLGVLPVLKAAKRLQMLDSDHVYLGFEQEYIKTAPAADLPFYDGLLYTQPLPGIGDSYDDFKESWTDVYFPLYHPSDPVTPPRGYATFSYDCVMALAYGFHRLLQSNDTFTPEQLVNHELNEHLDYTLFTGPGSSFVGASGNVSFDENGDRYGAYSVRNVRNRGKTHEDISTWDGSFSEEQAPVFFGGSTRVPADQAPPKPEYYLGYSEGISIALLIVTGLGIASALGFMFFIVTNRDSPVVKASSVTFCLVIIIGSLLGYSAIPVGLGEPTAAKCMAQPWLFAIGFTLIYASLFLKTWRIYKIFDTAKIRMMTIKNRELGIFTGIATTVDVVLLIIWTAVDPLVPARDPLSSPTYTLVHCSSSNSTFQSGIMWSLFAYNAAIILGSAYLAFKTRKVSTNFKESKYIGMSVYNVILVVLVVVPIVTIQGAASYQVKTLLVGLAIFLLSGFVLFMLFTPKVLAVINNSTGETTQDSSEKNPNNNLSKTNRLEMRQGTGIDTSPSGSPSILLSTVEPKDLHNDV